jgi:signal transduction histidine kinase
MNDPIVQTYIVGVAINIAGAAIALYLWTEHRGERFLLFWALAWATGLMRWLVHYPAPSNPILRAIEGLLIPATLFFMVLGSYDLLTSKPWRQRVVVTATAAVFVAYAMAAIILRVPLEMGYALFAATLAFAGGCMWVAYRSSRLSGYAFGAATCVYQLAVVTLLLLHVGDDVADSILVPLYNIPLILSIVVIAHQRDRLRLIDSERTTQRLYVRLANVEDDERRALHAELHDQVGANLSALRLELDVATGLLARNELSGVRAHLSGAREVAADTITMTRDLMAELRPPALDDYGLVAALRTYAESQSLRLNIPIHVAGDDLTPRPSPPVEGALFRIAQEAVVNAARHASAARVDIEVRERDGRVVLTVEDDGIGFDFEQSSSGPDHWGLKNMRERARAIGGELEVRTAPNAGTRVTALGPRSTG